MADMGERHHNTRYSDVESEDASIPSRDTDDQIDAILDNYNFSCKPEMRLKFKRKYVSASPTLHGLHGRLAASCKVQRI